MTKSLLSANSIAFEHQVAKHLVLEFGKLHTSLVPKEYESLDKYHRTISDTAISHTAVSILTSNTAYMTLHGHPLTEVDGVPDFLAHIYTDTTTTKLQIPYHGSSSCGDGLFSVSNNTFSMVAGRHSPISDESVRDTQIATLCLKPQWIPGYMKRKFFN